MKKKLSLPAALMMAVFLPLIASSQSAGGWKVLHTFPVSGNGFWDYLSVEPGTNHLFVSHGTQVNIVDKNTGASLGVVPNTTGVHGITFVKALGKGYISSGRLNSVTVFDLKTFAVLKQIPVGENPDAIFYEDFSKRIITCNGRSKDLSVIDPSTDRVVATVPLGSKPETAVSDGKGTIFVNDEDNGALFVVDAKNFKLEKSWSIAPGEGPTGLVIDRQTHRLFAGCHNKLLMVINAENGKVVAKLPIGSGCDGVGFDPALHYIFTSNGEGTVTIVHEKSADQFAVVANVPTKRGARTITVDVSTHRLYLPTAEFGPAPAATADNPRPRPRLKPDSFQVLQVGKE